jgi:hypothetical protein
MSKQANLIIVDDLTNNMEAGDKAYREALDKYMKGLQRYLTLLTQPRVLRRDANGRPTE